MNRLEIRDAIESTVEPLSDITRTAVWQRIETRLDAPVAPPRRSHLPVAFAGAAALVVLGALVVFAARPDPRPATPVIERAVLAASAGSRAEHAIAGAELALHGPGRLEAAHTGGRLELVLPEGALHVRAIAEVLVRTPTFATEMPPGVFAVRVHAQATEVASGDERARALIDRHVHDLGAAAAAIPETVESPPPPPRESAPPAADVTPPPRRERSTKRPRSAISHTTAREPVEVATTARAEEPSVVSAAELYAQAEQALRRGDRTTATRLLEQVVASDATGRLAATARYDLARLALAAGDHATALRHVEHVLASGAEPNLVAPARALRCRILGATGEGCAPAR